jgi:hypothetical protein
MPHLTISSVLAGRFTPGLRPGERGGTYADSRQLMSSTFFPSAYLVTWQQITSPVEESCDTWRLTTSFGI